MNNLRKRKDFQQLITNGNLAGGRLSTGGAFFYSMHNYDGDEIGFFFDETFPKISQIEENSHYRLLEGDSIYLENEGQIKSFFKTMLGEGNIDPVY